MPINGGYWQRPWPSSYRPIGASLNQSGRKAAERKSPMKDEYLIDALEDAFKAERELKSASDRFTWAALRIVGRYSDDAQVDTRIDELLAANRDLNNKIDALWPRDTIRGARDACK